MRSYYKKIVLLSIVVICCFSCFQERSDTTWDIIAVGLPKVISPSIANINMGLYILKQTHEPLFRYKKRTQLYSNLLDTWDRDIKYEKFNFCLKRDLYFSKGDHYSVTRFKKDLEDIAKKLRAKYSVQVKNKCIKVLFDKGQPSFLDLLTKYENSPSSRQSNKTWENGLGPFVITSMKSQKILLKRKKKVNYGFNSINFWAYSGKDDEVLKQDGIEDYNRVLIQDLPTEKIKHYQKFNVALLQTINLVLNVKNLEFRKVLFNCINISEFREAFMPKQRSFLDVGSILPIGIPFSKNGKAAQDCKYKEGKNNPTIKFYNWNKSSSESLKNYFSTLHKKVGLSVEVVNISMNEFVDMVLKSPHPYDLTVVALDAIDVDYDAYFSPIINEKSIVDVDRSILKNVYEEFKMNKPNKKSVQSVTSEISNQHLLLPLYQEVRDFYFPKHIKSLTLGKNDLEYLEISELRI